LDILEASVAGGEISEGERGISVIMNYIMKIVKTSMEKRAL
jgi:hypothetical protein